MRSSQALYTRGERREWFDLRSRRILNLSAWLLVLSLDWPRRGGVERPSGKLSRSSGGSSPASTSVPRSRRKYIAWADNIAALLDPKMRLTTNHFVSSPASWPLVWAAIQTLLLVPAVVWLKSNGRRVDAAFAAIVLAATLISLWSVTRIVDGITQYGIVWISAVGVLGLSVLAGTGTLLIATKTGVARVLPSRTVAAVVVVLLAALGIRTWSAFSDYGEPPRVGRREKEAQDLYEGVRTFIRDVQVRKPSCA